MRGFHSHQAKIMTKPELVELLKEDLRNEYKHMVFYLNAGVRIIGLHREEIGEYMLKEARDEMNHVEQFSRLIIDLGGVPDFGTIDYPKEGLMDCNPKAILRYAFEMETEVVERYVGRINDAVELGGVDGKYVEIFLEDQIMDSRSTAAHYYEMLKGF